MVEPRRWLILTVGITGQVVATFAANVPPFLIPYLHLDRGLSLTQAGLLAAAPLIGTMATLVLWGTVIDRYGERAAMTAGLLLSAVGGFGAITAPGWTTLGLWWLVLGFGAASTNTASGQLVVGWFEEHQRGFAMGVRQTAMPIGVGIAAIVTPVMVEQHGLHTTLALAGTLALATALLCAIGIVDAEREPGTHADRRARNPYRRPELGLVRIHASSALLVVPQYTVWTFMLVWLIGERGWDPGPAGLLVATAQILGAAGRIAVGAWSDRVGSRMGPMRQIAVASGVTMVLLAVVADHPVAVAVMLAASVLAVADNGLAFTAVAERAGAGWSGRVMGLHNTCQYMGSALVPPGVGAVIAGPGYAWAFALVAIGPFLAVPLIPARTRTV